MPTPPNEMAALQSTEEKNRIKAEASTADWEKVEAKKAGIDSQRQEETARLFAGEPEPKPMPAPPYRGQHGFADKFTIASSVLMLVSVVGSKAMKTGSVGAMSAMTAALTGLMQGDEVAYKRNMDGYKMHVRAIEDANELQADKFKRILAKKHLTDMEQLRAINDEEKAAGLRVSMTWKEYNKSRDATAALRNKMVSAKMHDVGKKYTQEELDYSDWAQKPENKGKSIMQHHKEWTQKNSNIDLLRSLTPSGADSESAPAVSTIDPSLFKPK
jgi:hypothetical protein